MRTENAFPPATLVLAGLVAVATGAGLAVAGPPGGLAVAAGATLALLVWERPRLTTRVYLAGLALLLLGYAVGGRGFAYLGLPPLFVGEAALLTGGLLVLRRLSFGMQTLKWFATAYLAFVMVGLAATLPHLPPFGFDALRDAALWAYTLFAVITYSLLRRTSWLAAIPRLYGKAIPWLLLLMPVSVVLTLLAGSMLPQWPSGVGIIDLKGGDAAVHLAGILAFLALGLDHPASLPPARASLNRWTVWLLWVAALVAVSNVRAGLVSIAVAGIVLLLLSGSRARVMKPLLLCCLVLGMFLALDVRLDLGRGREISARGVVQIAASVVSPVDNNLLDTSRSWRLEWWGDIIDYTLNGQYFWTGKGYGINLANSDGYQVLADDALRSPHNGHLTFLARSGVPGFAAWLLLLVLMVAYALRALIIARRTGLEREARLITFLLCYLAAALTNATFDVYLEGPQGAIWTWCVVGAMLAVSEAVLSGVGQSGAQDAQAPQL